jgi:hypothetical protein
MNKCAHFFRRIAGMPSGPGAESSLISDIASSILSGVNTISESSLLRVGTVNVSRRVFCVGTMRVAVNRGELLLKDVSKFFPISNLVPGCCSEDLKYCA